MNPEEEFNYRVKVYIPEFYEIFGQAEVFETLSDAIKGLDISGYKIVDAHGFDGVYLYLFSSKIFPHVGKGEETPDGELKLSASEGWKVKWSKLIKSPILTIH